MRLRWGQKPGPLAWAVLAGTIGWFGITAAWSAERPPSRDRAVSASRSDTAVRPGATFFSINEVLAKLDRERAARDDAVRIASIAPPESTATDAGPVPPALPQVGPEPFGLYHFRAPHGLLWTRWTALEADIARDGAVLADCREGRACPPPAAQFLRLVADVGARTGRDRIEAANRAINELLRYVSDLNQFGELDRWTAPLTSLASGRGDCEDYAIAKYVLLREAGLPDTEMRLVLGRDRSVRQDHAVLAVRHGERWLILDNRWSELRDDNGELNFTPLFAISHAGVHLLAAPYAKLDPDSAQAGAVPAAAAETDPEWTGADGNVGGSVAPATHPLAL